ncbi:uncharacterized protein F5891DRAFT_536633 [Suillus fuscotomentosus]|uniref:Uncharacterized protein n=1 Tax=Suillus fuscotomentosus TaxID=1912939 RepID=A0AAD4E0B1_9AGAM|nr:uncharacterized protein F5891DRAFT_536633 [Suillus fuscotomentosus]KAG1897396.1 hypothetical protein F5891DRAFT_536633 [Suillus fuscotomentosus]
MSSCCIYRTRNTALQRFLMLQLKAQLISFVFGVFSSSTEACTDRCADLSSTVLEALQIPNFSYKHWHDRLDFTPYLIAGEVNHTGRYLGMP